jgi:hypothetical protein
LGSFTTAGRIAVGLDALDTVVQQMDDDWLGIDGTNDPDWFSFSVTGATFAKIQVKPIGPTYETAQQGIFNAAEQSDLAVQLFSVGTGVSLIASADTIGLGLADVIDSQYLIPGDYYFRVRGKNDANQFYRIDLLLDDRKPMADFDVDGDVDAADLVFWQTGYGLAEGAVRGDGDANNDGVVDGRDFLVWQRQVGLNIFPTAAIQSIPEAQTLLLAAMGSIFFVPRRGRRSSKVMP